MERYILAKKIYLKRLMKKYDYTINIKNLKIFRDYLFHIPYLIEGPYVTIWDEVNHCFPYNVDAKYKWKIFYTNGKHWNYTADFLFDEVDYTLEGIADLIGRIDAVLDGLEF